MMPFPDFSVSIVFQNNVHLQEEILWHRKPSWIIHQLYMPTFNSFVPLGECAHVKWRMPWLPSPTEGKLELTGGPWATEKSRVFKSRGGRYTKHFCLTWDWLPDSLLSRNQKKLRSLVLRPSIKRISNELIWSAGFYYSSQKDRLGMPLKLWHWLWVPGDAEQGSWVPLSFILPRVPCNCLIKHNCRGRILGTASCENGIFPSHISK